MRRLRTIGWMAWRDLRAQPLGFQLYALALGLGIGAMVAVSSFRDNVQSALERQARSLLGADLAVRARRPFAEPTRAVLARVPGAAADEIAFRTMAWFPSQGQARFVQVRALEGAFPFYGTLETEPPDAARRFQDEALALVEENALIQVGAEVGDRVRLGAREFTIAGRLLRAPGESPSEAFIAPRVYIPLRYVSETALVQEGSVVSYRRYFRLDDGSSPAAWAEAIARDAPDARLETETAESRKRALLGSVDSLARYLDLVGFVGLLLGCVGVAGAVQVYVARRLPVVAMLRCLGAPAGFCVGVLAAQVAWLGLAGAALGVGLAAGVLPLVATWLGDFLAGDVQAALSVRAVGIGVGAGLLFSLGFASVPLLAARRVTPAAALSRFAGERDPLWRDPLRLVWVAGLGAAVMGFAMSAAAQWNHGVGFVLALALAFALLTLAGRLLRAVARRAANRLPWMVLRQGLAGLYRPNNQTGLMLASIGLGAFLLALLQVAERSLRTQLSAYRAPDQPTLVLVDVQPDQREAAAETVKAAGLPVLNETPIVTMRLHS